jgi:hypothetical protein
MIQNKIMLATVALPIYNNKDICWLTLEGLIRQEQAGEWELIACEEQNGNHCGIELFESYKERLFKAGCIRIIYLPIIEGRFYLSDKWRFMAKYAKGEAFLLQGSDDYPDPRRIAEAKKAIDEGFDWYHTPSFYTYLRDRGVYSYCDENELMHVGIDKGTKTEYVKKCNSQQVKKGVDGWMLKNVMGQRGNEFKVKRILYDDYKGMSTTGFNTISVNRDIHIFGNMYPYCKSEKQLQDIIPLEVATKLKQHEVK